ncbi:GNAT family N-acetyltransferase [Mycoplasmatota bacterium]|nr:GNAT family N-acetyltransferase [Mycoplasmatota bacterium]
MKIKSDLFIEKIKKLYIQNPCYLSSIALWKTEKMLKEANTYEVIDQDKIYLYALSNNNLIFYWSNQLDDFILTKNEISNLDILILHDNFYQLIKDDLVQYKIDQMNPLIYKGNQESITLHEDYLIKDFDFNNRADFVDAAKLINEVYAGHHHTEDEIKSWMNDIAFDPSLWFWIKEENSNEKAALAISTYQASVKKSYLDWIQVSPSHQKKGLGKVLVYETIRRSIDKSNIIRVTGITDEFYKTCGFISQDKWWYIKKS